jgi:hypothetical protein
MTTTNNNIIHVPNFTFVETAAFDHNINQDLLARLIKFGCTASDFEVIKMKGHYGLKQTAPNRKEVPCTSPRADINAFHLSKTLEHKFQNGKKAGDCQRGHDDPYSLELANKVIANEFDYDFTPYIAVDKRLTFTNDAGELCMLYPVNDRANEAVEEFLQVIDGQHRLAALFDRYNVRKYVFNNDKDAEIVVTAKFFIGDFDNDEYRDYLSQVFLDKNATQKPMDKTHLMMLRYQLRILKKDVCELIDALIRMNNDENSPLFNKIWFGTGDKKAKENKGKFNAETLVKNNETLIKDLRNEHYSTVEKRYAMIVRNVNAWAETSRKYATQLRANPLYSPTRGVKGGKIAWVLGQTAHAIAGMHAGNVQATEENFIKYWCGALRLVSGVNVTNTDRAKEVWVTDLARAKGDTAQYIVNPATKEVMRYEGVCDRFGGGSNIRASMVRDARYVCFKLFNS